MKARLFTLLAILISLTLLAWFISGGVLPSAAQGPSPTTTVLDPTDEPTQTKTVLESLPTKYVGSWSGSGVQTYPAGSWTVLMTLTVGEVGSVIGTIAYPSLSCGGELTLTDVNVDSIQLFEDITFGNCVDEGTITLELRSDDNLDYVWVKSDFPGTANGTLTKARRTSYTISGQVVHSNGNFISNVTISTNTGANATTDATGIYTITGLLTGTYTLTPAKDGYTFSPPSRMVSVPPDVMGQDFVGTTQTQTKLPLILVHGIQIFDLKNGNLLVV